MEKVPDRFLCLIHQASFLLGRQLQVLERTFLAEGGYTERLYRQRQDCRGAP